RSCRISSIHASPSGAPSSIASSSVTMSEVSARRIRAARPPRVACGARGGVAVLRRWTPSSLADVVGEAGDELAHVVARGGVGHFATVVEHRLGTRNDEAAAGPEVRPQRAEYGKPSGLRQHAAERAGRSAGDGDRLVAKDARHVGGWT